ncbi:unnamed protein product [Psylliodes chrysocephalus]|uniref:Regulatory protein zeste n=1 Tax=Psylliodes chrysocephalus TaxID=3402493 RepID=A0A9P0CPX4_9CUCU|nr:unnamed protein product [Psylliodes chrysocephala]
MTDKQFSFPIRITLREEHNTPDETDKSALKFINSFHQKQSYQTDDINISPLSPESSNSGSSSTINNSLALNYTTAKENHLENEVNQIVKKLDQLLGMVADIKIDLVTIKDGLPELFKNDVDSSPDGELPLPLTNLEDLEMYNAELLKSEQERKKFVNCSQSMLEMLLRAQFIRGLLDATTRERILQLTNISFEKAKEIDVSIEISRKENRDVYHSSSSDNEKELQTSARKRSICLLLWWDTIESKKSGAFSWKQKEAVWKKLEKEFNCSNTATSYKDTKTLKTNDIDLAVKYLIGKQIDGLQSEFDSDADAIKGFCESGDASKVGVSNLELPEDTPEFMSLDNGKHNYLDSSFQKVLDKAEKEVDAKGDKEIDENDWSDYTPKILKKPVTSKLQQKKTQHFYPKKI